MSARRVVAMATIIDDVHIGHQGFTDGLAHRFDRLRIRHGCATPRQLLAVLVS
jgi:hypothetical protein